jgi:probable HAF family extracellular repeat protein
LFLALLSLAAVPLADAYPQKNTATYTYTDLGGLPGLSFEGSGALGVNDYGEIVGSSWSPGPNGPEQHVVVWAKDATGTYAITDLGIGFNGSAAGINNEGDVAAGGFLVRPVTINGSLVWYEDLDGDGVNDLAIPLSAGGNVIDVNAINDKVQIVGGGSDVVQFDATGREVITTLPGTGYAINDFGEVAGEAQNGQAAIWQIDGAGKVLSTELLNPLAGERLGRRQLYRRTGSSSRLLSLPRFADCRKGRATVWLNGSTPTDLGAPPRSTSGASGMNIVNGVLQVVGSLDAGGGNTAFLWKNGVMTDLGKLISATGVSLYSANGINTHGQVVGSTRITIGKNNVEIHGFLLTPK